MVDLVGTCPKDFWAEWIAEGDAAGDPYTGEVWGWFTNHPMINSIDVSDRFYVVAHGKLRGYSIVTEFERDASGRRIAIGRRGGAVAATLPDVIVGFRGLRARWWERRDEVPFPNWRTP